MSLDFDVDHRGPENYDHDTDDDIDESGIVRTFSSSEEEEDDHDETSEDADDHAEAVLEDIQIRQTDDDEYNINSARSGGSTTYNEGITAENDTDTEVEWRQDNIASDSDAYNSYRNAERFFTESEDTSAPSTARKAEVSQKNNVRVPKFKKTDSKINAMQKHIERLRKAKEKKANSAPKPLPKLKRGRSSKKDISADALPSARAVNRKRKGKNNVADALPSARTVNRGRKVLAHSKSMRGKSAPPPRSSSKKKLIPPSPRYEESTDQSGNESTNNTPRRNARGAAGGGGGSRRKLKKSFSTYVGRRNSLVQRAEWAKASTSVLNSGPDEKVEKYEKLPSFRFSSGKRDKHLGVSGESLALSMLSHNETVIRLLERLFASADVENKSYITIEDVHMLVEKGLKFFPTFNTVNEWTKQAQQDTIPSLSSLNRKWRDMNIPSHNPDPDKRTSRLVATTIFQNLMTAKTLNQSDIRKLQGKKLSLPQQLITVVDDVVSNPSNRWDFRRFVQYVDIIRGIKRCHLDQVYVESLPEVTSKRSFPVVKVRPLHSGRVKRRSFLTDNDDDEIDVVTYESDKEDDDDDNVEQSVTSTVLDHLMTKDEFIKSFQLPRDTGEILFNVLDSNDSGSVSYNNVIEGLLQYIHGTKKQKIELLFQHYDQDNKPSGLRTHQAEKLISSLFEMWRKMNPNQLTDEEAEEEVPLLVEQAFQDAVDGRLSLKVFENFVNSNPFVLEGMEHAFSVLEVAPAPPHEKNITTSGYSTEQPTVRDVLDGREMLRNLQTPVMNEPSMSVDMSVEAGNLDLDAALKLLKMHLDGDDDGGGDDGGGGGDVNSASARSLEPGEASGDYNDDDIDDIDEQEQEEYEEEEREAYDDDVDDDDEEEEEEKGGNVSSMAGVNTTDAAAKRVALIRGLTAKNVVTSPRQRSKSSRAATKPPPPKSSNNNKNINNQRQSSRTDIPKLDLTEISPDVKRTKKQQRSRPSITDIDDDDDDDDDDMKTKTPKTGSNMNRSKRPKPQPLQGSKTPSLSGSRKRSSSSNAPKLAGARSARSSSSSSRNMMKNDAQKSSSSSKLKNGNISKRSLKSSSFNVSSRLLRTTEAQKSRNSAREGKDYEPPTREERALSRSLSQRAPKPFKTTEKQILKLSEQCIKMGVFVDACMEDIDEPNEITNEIQNSYERLMKSLNNAKKMMEELRGDGGEKLSIRWKNRYKDLINVTGKTQKLYNEMDKKYFRSDGTSVIGASGGGGGGSDTQVEGGKKKKVGSMTSKRTLFSEEEMMRRVEEAAAIAAATALAVQKHNGKAIEGEDADDEGSDTDKATPTLTADHQRQCAGCRQCKNPCTIQ